MRLLIFIQKCIKIKINYMNENTEDFFKAIVLSGGGSKGLFTLGALQYYYEKKLIDNVDIYAGTSIGAVICLLLVCGYTPMELFTKIFSVEYFFDILDFNTISDIIQFMGVMSIDRFTDKLKELIEEKFGCIPTLIELYELTRKTLVITVSNITKMKCEYYTYLTQPDLNCLDAIKYSCNLPLIFKSITYDGEYIADGGLMDNFPLQHVDDGKMKILGIISLGSDFSMSEAKFIGYFYRIMSLPMNSNTELRCKLVGVNTTLIKITNNDTPLFHFTIKSEKKMEMFLHGYKASENYNKI